MRKPTYNQIVNRAYGEAMASPDDYIKALDQASQKAWAAMRALKGRKGFDWWFDELPTAIQNSIFNDVRRAIGD